MENLHLALGVNLSLAALIGYWQDTITSVKTDLDSLPP